MLRIFFFLLTAVLACWAQFVPNQFIVEMSEERTGLIAERMARVRARQDALEKNLASRGFKTHSRLERVANALVVEGEGDEDRLEQSLRALPGVMRVSRVRLFQKTLDRAALIHRVSEVWQQVGFEKAGAGMRIGIIDTGIESKHSGFQDNSLPALEGYPKVNDERDLVHTNRKVIVARSYVNLLPRPDPDLSALDRDGHGTAVAMAAAGARHTSPQGEIAGMAPAAYLGVYKVFGTTGINDNASDSALLRAVEDAINDGMDVINLSLGSRLVQRPEDDLLVRALTRAEEAGIIVVVAAGNSGPGPMTVESPGIAPVAITVGANENGRLFASAVVAGEEALLAQLGSRTSASGSLEGPMVSVATLDSTELACNPLPANQLSGRIVLVLRGTCTFEVKNQNVADAGARGLILYSDAARAQDLVIPDTGSAPLPTMFLRHADGLRLKALLSNAESVPVVMDFAVRARDREFRRVASFSSRGPLPFTQMKPDLLAVGTNFYTAAQTNFTGGDLYSTTGYLVTNGTSFSAPVVAGMAATLKSLRPGLRPAAYRSLLINSARPLGDEPAAPLSTTGTGLADFSRALVSPVQISPSSVAFSSNEQFVELRNLTSSSLEYTVRVEPQVGVAPVPDRTSVSIAESGTARLRLALDLPALDVGIHAGVVVLSRQEGKEERFAYFFGKGNPAGAGSIQVLTSAARARSGFPQRNLVFFRVLDTNGLVIPQAPRARVITGSAEVRSVEWRNEDVVGAYGLDLTLGVGTNVIEVDAGNGVVQRFTMIGQ